MARKQAVKPEFDVVVVGGGSAGYAAARTTVAAGLKTAVIDGAHELGGLCILRGCMPTKALLQSAEVRHLAERAGEFGVKTGKVGHDFAQVMARKARLIGEFAEYRRGQLTDGRFELIRAQARFLDPNTVVVEGPEGRQVTSRHFVVATGSQSVAPPVPGLTEVGYWTSDDALGLSRLPRSIVVLGGGAVALEFAQFFARLGSRVTLVQRSEQILREADADAAKVLEGVLVKEGVELFTGTRLLSVERSGPRKVVHFEHDGVKKRAMADEILVALGRSPNTAALGLDRAGVTLDKGRIVTDAGMRTSVPHIYAGGDCTSLHEIVHLAVIQGEVAGHNIAFPKRPREMDDRLLIAVVFTDPQVASVGLTEKAAAARRVAFAAASYPFNDHGKSLILGATDGFVKLLADPRSGEILGGTCVGPHGGELIHEIVAAMAKRMTVGELAAMPHYHPTLAEIWTYPAEELAEQVAARGRRGRSPSKA
jgi:pyruvate/2-oxoglutarate dehydrogenase complex dihydrolipoamide dehydrogenase (E3) component